MKISKFPPESDDGYIEYKLKLINIEPDKLEKLTTQMIWRLHEGKGFTKYFLGLSDDGTPTGLNPKLMKESQDNLYKMTNNLPIKCSIHLLNTYIGIEGEIKEYVIKQINKYQEIKYDFDIRLSTETIIC